MRLADFIVRDMDLILAEWETFAATQLPAAKNMDRVALRDHAKQILQAVAADIALPQTPEVQMEKAKGRAPQQINAPDTAAETHALLRARSGFDINQMAAEYRALRAGVLRLWADASGPAGTDLRDTIRFNEAIDQALAESIAFFSAEVDQARNLLLGMLGHDMRNPLDAIVMTAAYLAKLNAGDEVSAAANRLISSGGRMKSLLDDLVDFNRTQLGLGINIAPTEVDLVDVFADELQQLRVAHPGKQIDLKVDGDVRGIWDPNRLHQLLGNLVSNAIKYGSPDGEVRVELTGMEAEVLFVVRNYGPLIEPSTLGQIFEPLKRGSEPHAGGGQNASLGLGLYISREVVTAHGGVIGVHSDELETVFTVRLPRLGRKATTP